MRDIFKLAFVLTVITVIAGFSLSYVKKITEEPIAQAKISEVKAPAVKLCFEGMKFDNKPWEDYAKFVVGKDKKGKDISVYAFKAKQGGKTTAVAIETFGTGYHDHLGVMTAIGLNGKDKDKIIRIAITSHGETPGKGDKIEQPDFKKQFANRSINDKIELGNVDAISGATMSTKGVIQAINEAMEIFKKNQQTLAG